MDDLKILILSTPKTGSTWLRNLLSGIYRLPQITLSAWPFDPAAFAHCGQRWITHYHYHPSPELVTWIRDNGIFLVTNIRHPADTLISLYHHVHEFKEDHVDLTSLRRMLLEDFPRVGVIPASVGAPFSYDLACSIEWMRSGMSHIVRYEDLRLDPGGVLDHLTSQLEGVPDDRIKGAVEACRLGLMRRLAGPFGGFFRHGAISEWQNILSAEIIDIFRQEPYRSQFAALGYTLDPNDPLNLRCTPENGHDGFLRLDHFDNGVPIVPIIEKCYWLADPQLRGRWPSEVSAIGPDSFFSWLNSPADLAAAEGYSDLAISNLAAFIYEEREDLRAAFPDLVSQDRPKFVEWFLQYAPREYGLEKAFLEETSRLWSIWSRSNRTQVVDATPDDRQMAGGSASPKEPNAASSDRMIEAEDALAKAHSDEQRTELGQAKATVAKLENGTESLRQAVERSEANLEASLACLQTRVSELENQAAGLLQALEQSEARYANSERQGQELKQSMAKVYAAAQRYSEVFDYNLDVYRSQRAWKLMLAVRRAYAMALRHGWKGRLRLLFGPRPSLADYELSFPALDVYLPKWLDGGSLGVDSTLPPHQLPPGCYDVVVLAIIDFDFRFQRPQQIAVEFARRGHRVFWLTSTQVLPPESPVPYRVVPLREGVWELHVRAPQRDPYTGVLTDDIARQYQTALEAFYRDWSISETAIVAQLPFWRRLAVSLRMREPGVLVYDCMDDWDTFENLGDFNRSEETQLAVECDVLAVTAEQLKQKFARRGLDAVLVRNGADFEFFRSAEALPELSRCQRPVVGYFGAIADWIDLELSYEVAKSRPDYSFVFVGQVFDRDTRALESLPNVRLLGSRPYEQMPRLLAGFDVCIIPFLLNQVTNATDPVKLYEYLSQGKPVVATDMSELRICSDLVYLARGSEQFAAQVDAAVAESDVTLRTRRIEFARTNSWTSRVSALDTAIRERFPKVSVLIVTFNSAEFLSPCLRSLSSETSYPAMEVIVIDNASLDESVATAEQFQATDERISIARLPSNTGFAGGNNAGAKLSSGEFLVFLNADAMVTPGWLALLLRHVKHDPSIGLICPTTNFAGNEAKINVDYTDEVTMRNFAMRIARQNYGTVIDIPVAPLFCALMRRDVFLEIGGLDEGYRIGMFEDDDLAEAVRARGLRVCAAEDCFVHHFGQGSFSKLDRRDYDRVFEANRRRFEQKWRTKWKPHQMRSHVRRPDDEPRFVPEQFCAQASSPPRARASSG